MKMRIANARTYAQPAEEFIFSASLVFGAGSDATESADFSFVEATKHVVTGAAVTGVSVSYPSSFSVAIEPLTDNVTASDTAGIFTVDGGTQAKLLITGSRPGERDQVKKFTAGLSYSTTELYDITGYGDSWIQDHNDRLEALFPETPENIYTDNASYNHHTDLGGRATRNTSAWFDQYRQALTALSTRQNTSVTMITRRHGLSAAHYAPLVGQVIRFRTADNQLIERTVVGLNAGHLPNDFWGNDRCLVTLDYDLPSTITPMQVVGDWYTGIPDVVEEWGINNTSIQNKGGWGPYALWVDTQSVVYASSWSCAPSLGGYSADVVVGGVNFGQEEQYRATQYHPDSVIDQPTRTPNTSQGPNFCANVLYPYGGCSGGPVMFPHEDNTLSLILVWGSNENGSGAVGWTSALNAMIARSNAALGISGTYTVTEGPSPF